MAIVSFKQLAHELEQRSRQMQKVVEIAAVKTLNDCAYKSMGAVSKEYEKVFHVRNKSFGRALNYTKARPNILMSSVYFKNDFMEIHTTGGKRKPTNEKVVHGGSRQALSVPIYENDRRMENGRTRQRDRVPSLLKYSNQHDGLKQKAKSGVKRPFLLEVKGKAFVVKRAKGNTTKESRHRNNGDLFLYSLKKDVDIERRWDFNKIVKEFVDGHIEGIYLKNLKYVREKE